MKHYTYLYLREDGAPYYVGKGAGRRAFIKHRHNGMECPPKERVLVYPAESEAEALETETVLIWYYGRKDLGTGCLRNLTNGGEGTSGRKLSDKSRLAIAQVLQGRERPESVRQKIARSHRGLPVSAETKRRMQASQKLRRSQETPTRRTAEQCARISQGRKGKLTTAGREAISNAAKRRAHA